MRLYLLPFVLFSNKACSMPPRTILKVALENREISSREEITNDQETTLKDIKNQKLREEAALKLNCIDFFKFSPESLEYFLEQVTELRACKESANQDNIMDNLKTLFVNNLNLNKLAKDNRGPEIPDIIKTYKRVILSFCRENNHLFMRFAEEDLGENFINSTLRLLGKGRPATMLTCNICLGQGGPSPWVRTHCNHKFHKECLRKWLIEKSACPSCRSAPIFL